jgi:hypothetical protein
MMAVGGSRYNRQNRKGAELDMLQIIWRKLWNGIKRDLPKTLLGVAVSGLGFLLALGINQRAEKQKEKDTYHSMLAAIRSEATANHNILETSYEKYFPQGLIVRELSYSTVSQMFANPLFMKYAKPEDIETLNAYVRDLALANGYRRVAETLTLQQPHDYNQWLDTVKNEWGERLPTLSADIDKVTEIKD